MPETPESGNTWEKAIDALREDLLTVIRDEFDGLFMSMAEINERMDGLTEEFDNRLTDTIHAEAEAMYEERIAALQRILDREVREFRQQRADIPQLIREAVVENMQPQMAQAEANILHNPFAELPGAAAGPAPPRFRPLMPVWGEDDVGPR